MSLVRRVQYLESHASVALVRVPPPAAPIPLENPADVLAVLGEQVNAVRADPLVDPNERARTLGFLVGVALRAMEANDLDQRLEAVERVLKLRKDEERDAKRRARQREHRR